MFSGRCCLVLASGLCPGCPWWWLVFGFSLPSLFSLLRSVVLRPGAFGASSSLFVGSAQFPGVFFTFTGAGRFARAGALLAWLRRYCPHWLALAVLVSPGVIRVGVGASRVVLFGCPHWSAWSAGSAGFVRFGVGGGQPRPALLR